MFAQTRQALLAQLAPLESLGVYLENSPNRGRPSAKFNLYFYWEAFRGGKPAHRNTLRTEKEHRIRFNLEFTDQQGRESADEAIATLMELVEGFAPLHTEPLYLLSGDFLKNIENQRYVFSMVAAFDHRFPL